MVKKLGIIKCEMCEHEFSDTELSEKHKDKAFIWDSQILCKDCLVMAGGDPNTSHTWWDYQHDENKAKPHDW